MALYRFFFRGQSLICLVVHTLLSHIRSKFVCKFSGSCIDKATVLSVLGVSVRDPTHQLVAAPLIPRCNGCPSDLGNIPNIFVLFRRNYLWYREFRLVCKGLSRTQVQQNIH